MTPDIRETTARDRWQQIQDVLADAIECAPADRPALLDARCSGDAELRREVESLLAAHEQGGVVDDLAGVVNVPRDWLPRLTAGWAGRRTGHYVVQDSLGAGGMGIVCRALDERLGRQVALKFLPPHLSADPDAKARFVAEARAAAALDHPNVCTIYEIGETEDGQLFIAMPLYEGDTLQARLARGRLTFDEALPIVLQIARGLAHAHDAGIVHRDVKPSNIAVLPDGTAKVLDFGIAQIADRTLADPHMIVGTASYMSPEQASARPVDARSDVWSLGVVLHEMLTGARPFQGDDRRAVREAILTGEPEITATSYPDVPAAVERILRRALARPVGDRYATMALFSADLAMVTATGFDRPGASDASALDDPTRVTTTERRRAAVLVTIVSDYASLVDQMAPAEAQRRVARVRDTAVDVVRAYGGLVNQAIGEEIVALFGVPVAHDDDDVRAVRAALELHARVRAAGDDRQDAVEVGIQSGLHVGPVVARRLPEGPRRYDIVGPPAAMAARLAALAGRGDVLVSPETQRLVEPYMQTAPCAQVTVDSQRGPVVPFLVLGETGIASRLEASSPAALTPYVGRGAELSLLETRVVDSAAGQGAMISVIGEPGAGKSRLLHELQQRLGSAPARVLRARCRAYGDSVPYGVFVQLLCAALHLPPPLGSAGAIVARIRALDSSLDQFLPLFLHLLSVPSDTHALPRHLHGEHLQAALLDALAALMSVLTQRGPLCVLIEDWHWADSGSRAALSRVAELTVSTPLVVIVTSRPEPATGKDWPATATSLRLDRLELSDSIEIMRSVLRVGHVPAALAGRLYDRAGGNPFFLEQMCAALLERGAVSVRGGEALLDDGGSGLSLPDTVQGVIRARLDNLNAPALEIVRIASVIGWEFERALLADVVPPNIELGPAIAALEAAGLIRETVVAPTIRYRFTHALTQEVCYDSLVGHQRKALHGAIGRALASTHTNRQEEAAALLAHHFGRAEDWPAAVYFGRRAAERAIAVSQFGDALATLDRVVEWVGHLPASDADDLMSEVLLQQERLCETLGLRARQQQIIDLLIGRLARGGSSARLAEVYLRQGDLSTLLKRFDAADRALGTAIRISQERGDTTLLRSGLRSLGLLRWHEGRHGDALEITRRALAVDQECEDEIAVATDLINLCMILRSMGDSAGARVQLEAAMDLPALRRDPRKLVYAQHTLANIYRAMGDDERAHRCLMESDELARRHLLPIQRSFHLTSMAHIELQQGRIEQALETYRTAVDLSRRARHAEGLVQSLRMLGNALLGLARYDEALPCLREAAQLFAQLEDAASEAEMWTGVARVLERTSAEAAADAWRTVLDLHRKRGDSKSELDAREGLARSIRALQPAEAVAAFEAALALASTIGERAREASIQNVLGILAWEQGRYADAVVHYEAALALVRERGSRADEAVILNSVGAALTRLGRGDEARTVLEESLALSRELGERQLQAHALAGLGHVRLSARDLAGARDCFEQSLAARRAAGDRLGEGWMHLRIAAICRETGVRAAAAEAAAMASCIAEETGDAALRAACGADPSRHA